MAASQSLTYQCAKCGGTFESFNDDAAHEEAQRNWGRRGDAPGMAIVCDDCYHAFMAWWHERDLASKEERDH